MNMNQESDIEAIRALIARQFASVSWKANAAPDWRMFKSDFLPQAVLYASARPVRAQSLEAFVERMNRLAGTTLHSFNEVVLGSEVRVFGNIAVAVVACENTENETEINRNVEMMLLVKDEGLWKIVAQAWDKEGESTPIPTELLAHV
ncbi:MAG: hypothetical protein WAL40_00860 [Rhodoplanes sp.]|jgi:hypothetical protein